MHLTGDPKSEFFECPSVSIWNGFLLGKVDASTLDNLSQHLETCSDCVDVLDEISSKPLIIGPLIRSPFLQEVNCHRLEERLMQDLLVIEKATDEAVSHGPAVERTLPELIGRFRIRGVLGSGGFGRVYLADDPLLQRTVAIKAPTRGDLGSELDVANFLNEARHAAALDHPSIVPIYDVIADDSGRTLIVMKHVKGRSLSALLRDGRLELERAVRLMIQVANAVHFAHEKGLVHRDLKPSNILLDDNNQPHVTDFGLGLNLYDIEKSKMLGGGTPPYMSPEQVRNDVGSIDRRSDIWSLGVMLAELVHGQRPFPQRDRVALFSAIAVDDPAIESSTQTTELDAIIRRCLEKSLVDRYATAEELARELSRWLQRHFPSGLAKWQFGWRRNLAAASIVTILVGSFWIVQFQTQRMELRSSLRQLESSPADQIPVHIDRLKAVKANASSIAAYGTPKTDSDRLRLALAATAFGDTRSATISGLADTVKTAQADEVSAVVKTLRGAGRFQDLGNELVSRLKQTTMPGTNRLPIAATLAGLLPEHHEWNEQRNSIANLLVRLPENDQKKWFPLFDPIGKTQLAEPLKQVMTSPDADRLVQTNATLALARYFEEDIVTLAELIQLADPEEIPPLVASLKRNRPKSVSLLKEIFNEIYPEGQPEQPDEEAPPTQTDFRLERLAIGLWMLDEPKAAFDAFRYSADPTLQTLVIHGLVKQNVAPKVILEYLDKYKGETDERSVSIRFGLLQVLSLLDRDSYSAELPVRMINEFWLNDVDCGVHSMTRLVAKRLGIELESLSLGDHGRWLVDLIGETMQDFVVIEPCVAELGIRDPKYSKLLTTTWAWHRRVFPRKIAVATNEVTIRQFRDLDKEHLPNDWMLVESPQDAAMMLLNLDVAYRFCNRLSENAGFELCYELRSFGEEAERLIPKSNYWDLTGYRLPTDGEWELACRAGTTTSRYFGNVHELVPLYGWVRENNRVASRRKNDALLSQRIALFLPNRWGMFDMYGNAKELCDMSIAATSLEEMCIDEAIPHDAKFRRISPLLRGCSFNDNGAVYATSHSRTNRIVVASNRTVGMRLARTLGSTETRHNVSGE